MQGLGYTQYASQGGDWSLRAIHLNFIVSTPPPLTAPVSFFRFLATHVLNWYTPQEASGLQKAQAYQQGDGNGYFEMQKQRPATIGFALADSPVALLAWIYDKLMSWTDDYPWTDSEVCEWVSLYWFSRAGPAASVVIYHDAFQGDVQARADYFNPGTKIGFSYFPKEMFRTPRFWNTQIGDVVFEREHEKGGHFAAWEQPEALADDLRIMFAKNGSAMQALCKRT
ncbi:hypothetical protein E8E14_009533 [Neopestalotiopsis sp. 37M]|nr:hypothetical protein E8E14_009533 [Neopestalotiopsis sp. 37M]